MTEEVCTVCTHKRRMHSRQGCFYQYEDGGCLCKKTFMDKPNYVPPQARGDVVSIADMIGSLQEANLKGGEVDAFIQEIKPRLANCVQDLADAISLNAGVLGSSSAESVNQAMALFQEAQTHIGNILGVLEEAQTSLRGAEEHNSQYIGRLLS